MKRFTVPLLLALSPVLACSSGGDDDGAVAGDCTDIVAGDLVITEVMANPAGEDTGNEYFEIYNAESAAVDVGGLTLAYSAAEGEEEETHVMGELTVESGGYVALGTADPEALPDFVDYGFGNDLGSLRNAGALLSLRCGDVEVDQAAYPSAEGTSGESWGLDGGRPPDYIANDTIANFCPATIEFAPDSFGSPGAANEPCNPVVAGTCSDGGTDRDVVLPAVGDLVITEFMASPFGADSDREWFEIHAARDVDLNGLVAVRDNGDSTSPLDRPECVHLAAGDHAIFARSSDPELNGDLPEVTETFGFSLVDAGSISIVLGDQILDQISWPSVEEGASSALDPTKLDPTSNDDPASFALCNAQYGPPDDQGRINTGTPGTGNEACSGGKAGMCMDGGTPRPIVSPAAGQILVSEALPNPAGMGTEVDPGHEWFEISALASFDLNGLEIGKADSVEQTLNSTNCLSVTSGERRVFAESITAAENGGLPQADFIKTFQLNNSDGSIFVGVAGTVLHTLSYGDAADGLSRQLDPDGVTICSTPETDPYGTDGDLGTPGAANPACP